METEQKGELFSGNKIFQKIGTRSKDEHNKEGERSFKSQPLLFQFCCKQWIIGCTAEARKKISWCLSTGTCQIHFRRGWQPSHIYSQSIWDWLDWMVKSKHTCKKRSIQTIHATVPLYYTSLLWQRTQSWYHCVRIMLWGLICVGVWRESVLR